MIESSITIMIQKLLTGGRLRLAEIDLFTRTLICFNTLLQPLKKLDEYVCVCV